MIRIFDGDDVNDVMMMLTLVTDVADDPETRIVES